MFVRKRAGGNQLVESYRDGGKPRQRVICNLGKHATPEDALAAARAGLEGLEGTARRFEARLKEEYAHALATWHGGTVPPLADVLANAQDPEYAEDFVGAYGLDLSEFIWELRELEDLQAQAAGNGAADLRERIATLEGVVSKWPKPDKIPR